MGKDHLKRLNAPRTWNINRKVTTFITRPNPGTYPLELSIPLSVFFKDLLKKVATTRDLKKMLQSKEVLVNGKRRKDFRHPVSFLDVVSVPASNENYRLLLSEQNFLKPVQIDSKEADLRLLKLTGKSTISKGAIQLSFFGGETLIIPKDSYKTGDTLVFSISKKQITGHLPIEKGATIFCFRGKSIGETAIVSDVKNRIVYFTKDKETKETKEECVFVIGKEKPLISLAKK
jgi:small subunit ribosomal protein S4e